MNAKTQKSDSTLATAAGRAPRLAAFRAWGTADVAAGKALLACFIACAEHGATDPQEVAEARGWLVPGADGGTVPNGSAKAYASTFNAAAKAASVLGIAKAKDLIESAAKLPGKAHENIAAACRAVSDEAKAAGVKEAKGATQARAFVKAAVAKVEKAGADKRAAAKDTAGKPRGARGQNAGTTDVAAAATLSGTDWRHNVAAVRLAANRASALPVMEGREAACRAYLKALQDAAELGAKLGA